MGCQFLAIEAECAFRATFPPDLAIESLHQGPAVRPAAPYSIHSPAGAGTTGIVADRLGRNALLIELNPATYAPAGWQQNRLRDDAGMFAEVNQ